MPYARRWRGAAPPVIFQSAPNTNQPPFIGNVSIIVDGSFRFRVLGQRRGKTIAPPWVVQQVTAPTWIPQHKVIRRPSQWVRRGRFFTPGKIEQPTPPFPVETHRPNYLPAERWWYRRARYFAPTPQQSDPITNGYWLPQRIRSVVQAWRLWQRRGKYHYDQFPATVTPTGPNFVPPRGQRRVQPPYARRAHIIQPIPPQADPVTNGYWLPQRVRQVLEVWRQWQRRGRYHYDQFAPSITPTGPYFIPPYRQKQPRPPYAKRGKLIWAVPPQANPNTNQPYFIAPYRQVRVHINYTKRARLVAPPNPPLGQWLPDRVYKRLFETPPIKRARIIAPPNPPTGLWFPQYVFRRLFELPPTRRAHISAPVPPQVVILPPNFVNWFKRNVVQRIWPPKPRGRAVQPGWGQAVAPPVTVGIVARYEAWDSTVATYSAWEEVL